MGERKKESQRFAKAHESILRDKDLTSPEKLVMIIICRYWPSPYWGKNETIADNLSMGERNIEKIIRALAKKKKITRGYTHRSKGNQHKTCRVIVPQCLPGKFKLDEKWIKPEQMDGQQAEKIDGNSPNNSSVLPEQLDDLLKTDNKKNKKKMPSPLPAVGQAPAFKRSSTPPSGAELKNRSERMIREVLEDEKKRAHS